MNKSTTVNEVRIAGAWVGEKAEFQGAPARFCRVGNILCLGLDDHLSNDHCIHLSKVIQL